MIFQTKNTVIRIGYVILIATVGFFVNVLIQEKFYGLAGLLTLVGVGFATLEILQIPRPKPIMKDQYTLSNWAIDKIIDKKTVQQIEARLQELQGKLNFDSQYKVHMTVHLAILAFHENKIHSNWILIQLTNYIGSGRRGKNRAVSAHKGIGGRSFRTRNPQTVNFESEGDYFRRMTKEFGFFPDEANYH